MKQFILIAVLVALAGLNLSAQPGPGNGPFPTPGGTVTATNVSAAAVAAAGTLSNNTTGNAATATTATNFSNGPHVILYSNNWARINGQMTNFPSSTTACIAEIQQIFPYTTNSGIPAGISIEIAQANNCGFTSRIAISNSMSFYSADLMGGGLTYYGPTNLFTMNQMTNKPWECGLIQLCTNTLPGGTNDILGYNTVNFVFHDMYLKVSTNMFATILGGYANELQMDSMSLLGPDMLTMMDNYTYNNGTQLEPKHIHQAQATVGASVFVAQQWNMRNVAAIELAQGVEVCGNSYMEISGNSYFASIGIWAGYGGTNFTAYPKTSLLGLGIGLSIDGRAFATFDNTLLNYRSYSCHIGCYTAGNTYVAYFRDQNSDSGNTIVVSPTAGGVTLNYIANSASMNSPLSVLVQDGAGNYYLTNNWGPAFNSQFPSMQVYGQYYNWIDALTGNTYDESSWFNFMPNTLHTTSDNAGAFDAVYFIKDALNANLAHCTNLPTSSLVGGFTGIVTNLWSASVSNRLYFTNGALIRMTTP